jgi:DNA-binding MarR family transcriptional regulator
VSDEEHVLTAEVIRRLLYRRDTAVARHRAAFARRPGVTDIEMLALVHIAEHGELAPSALAKLLGLSSGGVTALVQRLERAGHVTRKPHPTDRRSTLITLAQPTGDRLEEAESPPYRHLASFAEGLADSERAAVGDMLSLLALLSEELEQVARSRAKPPEDVLARPVPSLWA